MKKLNVWARERARTWANGLLADVSGSKLACRGKGKAILKKTFFDRGLELALRMLTEKRDK